MRLIRLLELRRNWRNRRRCWPVQLLEVTSRKPGPLRLNEARSARETCLLGLLEALRTLSGESSWLGNNSAATRRSKSPWLELWLLLELGVLLLLETGGSAAGTGDSAETGGLQAENQSA